MSTGISPATSPTRDPGPFGKKDTDLGKFSHGNFDVAYDPDSAELMTTFRAKYEFEDGIPARQKEEFKLGMLKAIEVWDRNGFVLHTEHPDALNSSIALRFKLVETNNYNKVIDVAREEIRPYVFADLNISIQWRYSITTLAHELGHVFGNYDEYGGTGFSGWLERRMWWHDNDYLDDTDALMNEGTAFRARYFDHYRDYVNEQFEQFGIVYKLIEGKAVRRPRSFKFIKRNFSKSGLSFGYVPSKGGTKDFAGPIRGLNRDTTRLYVRDELAP